MKLLSLDSLFLVRIFIMYVALETTAMAYLIGLTDSFSPKFQIYQTPNYSIYKTNEYRTEPTANIQTELFVIESDDAIETKMRQNQNNSFSRNEPLRTIL